MWKIKPGAWEHLKHSVVILSTSSTEVVVANLRTQNTSSFARFFWQFLWFSETQHFSLTCQDADTGKSLAHMFPREHEWIWQKGPKASVHSSLISLKSGPWNRQPCFKCTSVSCWPLVILLALPSLVLDPVVRAGHCAHSALTHVTQVKREGELSLVALFLTFNLLHLLFPRFLRGRVLYASPGRRHSCTRCQKKTEDTFFPMRRWRQHRRCRRCEGVWGADTGCRWQYWFHLQLWQRDPLVFTEQNSDSHTRFTRKENEPARLVNCFLG